MRRKTSKSAMDLLAGHRECELCGDVRNLEVHHIVPVCCGGSDSIDNLIVVCGVCHAKLTPRKELQRIGIDFAKKKEDKVYRGRKPIDVDEALLRQEVAKWRSGLQSARQTMYACGLKPNTFYRRVNNMMGQSLFPCDS